MITFRKQEGIAMESTKIQWTDATVNFWTGCKKVSAGCKYCYMYRDKERYGQVPDKVTRTSDKTFNKALSWETPKRIFTCSWSDFFIEEADKWRKDAWDIIRKTPQHQWQILTKRPERIIECLPEDWGEGWDNVWLGVSVENQAYLHRAETLAKIPSKTRFISAEPLLGRIDFLEISAILKGFHWCIIGGESGNENGKYKYRKCELEWIENIVNNLKSTPVRVFVKQFGTHLSKTFGYKDRHGGKMEEWPTKLQIREFPRSVCHSAPALKLSFSDYKKGGTDDLVEGSKFISGEELLKMKITKLPTLVDPIIPRVGITALAGTSDIGKSTLLLQLCCDVALNSTFLGFTINAIHKSAIYVSTEDDKYTISYRLRRYEECDHKKLANVAFLFHTENLAAKLDKQLKMQKADLVVIDTFADIFSGEMNQANKVRSFLNEFSDLATLHECVFIFNHHTGKYTEEKPPNKNNVIGSQGFEGKARLVIELRPDYKDALKKHLCIVKGNYLDSSYKGSSYELVYSESEGFKITDVRVPFDELCKPVISKSLKYNEIIKKEVIPLRENGETYRAISSKLKSKGIKISKSTLANKLKNVSKKKKP